MPHVEVGGRNIYYEETGEGEPLLAVMGLSADTLAWALQVQDWSKAHRLVIFDNRDVGQSSYAEAPYEVEDMAADALGLADQLDLDAFHLVGLSLGGAISQRIALDHPDRVRTLQLVVTYGGAGNAALARASTLGAIARKSSRAEFVDLLMFMTMSEAFFENQGMVDFLRTAMLGNPHPQEMEAFVRQLEAGSRHEVRERLGELSMPVHVIGAEEDIMVPVWKSREIHELVEGSRYTVVEDCGHAVNIEKPHELNPLVLDFIAQTASG